MSTLALDGSRSAARERREGGRVRHLDLAVLTLALPVFVLADWPLLGYAVAAAAWLAQRGILALAERRAAAALAEGARRSAMGITGASVLGRVWLMALAVLLVGLLGEREDGLAAALLLVLLFTIQLGRKALSSLLDTDPGTTS